MKLVDNGFDTGKTNLLIGAYFYWNAADRADRKGKVVGPTALGSKFGRLLRNPVKQRTDFSFLITQEKSSASFYLA